MMIKNEQDDNAVTEARQHVHVRKPAQIPGLPSSQSTGDDEEKIDPDIRGLSQTISGISYNGPFSYKWINFEGARALSNILWFSGIEVMAGAKKDFAQLQLYTWDGLFYWCVDMTDFYSSIWKRAINVDDEELPYGGSANERGKRRLIDVAKDMLSLASDPLIEEEVNVEFQGYQYFIERLNVAILCSLDPMVVNGWRSRYILHADAMVWHRDILNVEFCYVDCSYSMYWHTKYCLPGYKLSGLEWLVNHAQLVMDWCRWCQAEPEALRQAVVFHLDASFALMGDCMGESATWPAMRQRQMSNTFSKPVFKSRTFWKQSTSTCWTPVSKMKNIWKPAFSNSFCDPGTSILLNPV